MGEQMSTEIQWTAERAADGSGDTRYTGRSAGVVVYVVDGHGKGSDRCFLAARLTSDGGQAPVAHTRYLRPMRLKRNAVEECEYEWEGLDDATRTAIVNELRDRQQHIDALNRIGYTGPERMSMAELVEEVARVGEREAAASTTVTFSAPLPPELTELAGFRLGDVVTFGDWPERWRIERLLPADGVNDAGAALVDVNPRPGHGEHRTAGPLRLMRHIDEAPAVTASAHATVRVAPAGSGNEFRAHCVQLEPGERRNVHLDGVPTIVVGLDAVTPGEDSPTVAALRAEVETWRERARERGQAYRELLMRDERTAEKFGDAVRSVLKGYVSGSMENDAAMERRDRVTDPELVIFHPADIRSMIDDAVREIQQ